ncbi:hypothetical protein GOEFS_075_00690 [Gordonia effusa NBRC 100432]|uniref:Uncharacterized protein n=1 Tax=Gordonia effusa NBRC 100432 TaxID=1077974 RepID=H0R243_9ACTN|nr:hypothetical protein [Gordonia effusa]GAB19148.1 hypothetical protein GOEFS_075_00690 [Gordonia effusa NBRC 100432]
MTVIADQGRQCADETDGFGTVIAMAEAADCSNMTWWNSIRTSDPHAAYVSSQVLAELIKTLAHREGIPVADVWDHLRRAGRIDF